MEKQKRTSGLNNLHQTKLRALSVGKNHADGGGLYLTKTSQESGSWFFIYINANKTRKQMSLGKYPDMLLSLAREKAGECRKMRANGIDPLQSRKDENQKEIEQTQGKVTFGGFFDDWFPRVKAPSLTSDISRKQWESTIKTYCISILDKPIADIDEQDVLACVEPIWQSNYPTASKLLGRIRLTINAAIGQKIRPRGLNPADWEGCQEFNLPKTDHVIKSHAAIDWRLMPQFMLFLRTKELVTARALEFAILNANRLGEALGAKWGEIDFTSKVWNVPAARMKKRKDHRIPLSNRAIEILEQMKPLSDCAANSLIFEGQRRNHPYTSAIMEKHTDRLAALVTKEPATPHGFRSSFRDWGFEQAGIDFETMEVCLAHAAQGVVKNYRHGDALERRRLAMQSWCDYCQGEAAANVIPFVMAG